MERKHFERYEAKCPLEPSHNANWRGPSLGGFSPASELSASSARDARQQIGPRQRGRCLGANTLPGFVDLGHLGTVVDGVWKKFRSPNHKSG